MNNNNFLEKIKFNNVNWFRKNSEINFLGKNEIWNLINFYLQNKTKIKKSESELKKIKKNADRFKINCILWNNWIWKTKVLSNIIHFFENSNFFSNAWDKKIIFSNWEYLNYIGNGDILPSNNFHSFSEISYIFDDFFILSDMNNYSVNKKILNEKGYNKFYCNIYNFLKKDKNTKKIFSWFLNLEKNYQIELRIGFNSWWYQYFWWNYLEFIEYKTKDEHFESSINKGFDFSKSYNIFKYFYLFLSDKKDEKFNNLNKFFSKKDIENIWINLWDLFIATINNYWNLNNYNWTRNIVFNEYTNLFLEKLDIILFFLELIKKKNLDKHYNDIWEKDVNKCKIKTYFPKIISQIDNLKLFLNYLKESKKDKAEEIAEKILWWNKKYWTYSYELENILNQDKMSSYSEYFLLDLIYDFQYYDLLSKNKINTYCIATFRNLFEMRLKSDYGKILNNLKLSLNVKDYNLLSNDEINILSFPIFNINLKFWDIKSFNNLSSWEKTMLTRFTNIYIDILKQNKDWIKNFIILMDEPDLHLHYEWQKEYIKKLIDIFSTLNTNIKFHFIIATHSPFLISDLPRESIILLDRENNETFQVSNKNKTFWANFVDIIREWFFFKDKVLMWSFSESIIWKIADNERFCINNWEIKENKLKDYIWDDFLKDNLLYFKSKQDD